VLICDDVRQEVSGKEIIIGLYNDSVLFNSFPITMSQFIIRISLDILDKGAKSATMALIDTKGNQLNKISGGIDHNLLSDHLILGYTLQALTFNLDGTHEIHFGLDDDPLVKISDFDVRLPKDDKERARIPGR
jgi:hypothetical protein